MYEIKDEEIDGNNAEITVEIEVMDYKKIVNEINSSYQGQSNFTNEDYNNAKLEALEHAKDKVTYTIEFEITYKGENIDVDPTVVTVTEL